MAKVRLEIITDSTALEAAMNDQENAVEQLQAETKELGKVTTTVFKKSAEEVKKLDTEMRKGTEQVRKAKEETDKFAKTGDKIKTLKQQIRELTNEAIKLRAKGDMIGAERAIKQAGDLKDQVNDVNEAVKRLTGNTAQNLAGAFGNTTQLAMTGYQGVLAVQGLVGVKNEEFTQTLVKLQSINALSQVASEFGDLGDRVDQIKAGFSGFIGTATSGLKSLWAAMLANPMTVMIAGIAALSVAFLLLKDSIFSVTKAEDERHKSTIENTDRDIQAIEKRYQREKELAEAMGKNAEAIERKKLEALLKRTEESIVAQKKVIDKEKEQSLRNKTQTGIGWLFFSGKESDESRANMAKLVAEREDLIKQLGIFTINEENKIEKSLSDAVWRRIQTTEQEYSRRIDIAKANQQETIGLEIEKANAVKKIAQDQMDRIQQEVDLFGGGWKEAQVEEFDKLAEKVKEIDHQLKLDMVANSQELARKRKELNDKYLEQVKELAKRLQDAEASGLTSEDKIKFEERIALRELELFKKGFEERGKAANENFKLSEEQIKQFAQLEEEIYENSTKKLLDLQLQRTQALFSQRQQLNAQNLQAIEQEESAMINAVSGQSAPQGVSEVTFEKAKQEKIYEIQIEYALKKQAAKEAALIEERNFELQILNDRIASGDETAKLELQILENKYRLERELIKNETDKTVNDLKKKQEDLNKNKLSIKNLFGLENEEVQAINDSLKAVTDAVNSALNLQIQKASEEVKSEQEKTKSYEKTIDELSRKVEEEKALNEQGRANNLSATQKELDDRKALLEKQKQVEQDAIEKKKELQKQQIILDSALQINNIITAATSIYKGLAAIDPTNISGTIAVAALIAGFIATKKQALDAVNAQNFAEGVIDLKGQGTATSDSIPANLSRGESVMTAKETKEHKGLLTAIRNGNQVEYASALLKELQSVSSTMPNAAVIAAKKDAYKNEALRVMMNNDFSELSGRIDSTNKMLEHILAETKNKYYVDGSGNLIKQSGTHTTVVKRNGR